MLAFLETGHKNCGIRNEKVPAVKHQSLAQIARDLRDQTVSATALVEGATARYSATDGTLNAYKHWAGAEAKQQAEAVDVLINAGHDLGPLMGLPISVKDLYGVPKMPVFAGTDTEFGPEFQAAGPVVQAARAQLAIVMGKTHTVEFAFGGIGTNAHWGAPVNPWSAKEAPRVSGGSSSGAGVSLAQGSALVALGTDTAGSVRIPASFTGQAALKTTIGRWSTQGIVPLSQSLDTPGLLTRTVADLAYAFSAIDSDTRKVDAQDVAGVRIGVIGNVVWDDIDPAIAANTEAALTALERKGATVTKMTLPGVDDVLDIFRQGGLAASELRSFMDTNFPDRIARLDPAVRARIETADQISSTEYLRRKAVMAQLGQDALSVFDEFDVLICPTVPVSAPLVSDLADGDAYRTANMLALRNTSIVNSFGWCAATLPSGLDGNGVPSGLQLIAPPMQERRLLAIAQGVENTIGNAPELLGAPPLA
ncbi:aspartyl-tRNA(Asn)/glutamyl-tRNA(Gln) amidotransferase subunit A [Litoreibacter albidus]|uniref:Aspartyl-tRNA(Asn)/glutamyl-tRNA(Gln) amidotransferase subunit A n=1 Tax=Litoreibacter albidus TaxID=670155 RepID=A0A1H3CMM6_9RHOB|nr:aspartyl-tRNA(Asn)/glutamyl-tRNA(Gln) amidotransferase subunit A [Litoreibacter albidus]